MSASIHIKFRCSSCKIDHTPIQSGFGLTPAFAASGQLAKLLIESLPCSWAWSGSSVYCRECIVKGTDQNWDKHLLDNDDLGEKDGDYEG